MNTDISDLAPPTKPAMPKGINGLPVTEEWWEYYAKDNFPYGTTEPLWNEEAVRASITLALERIQHYGSW